MLKDHQRYPEALKLFDRSISLCERIVNQEDREGFRGDLAWARALKAETLLHMDRKQTGTAEAVAAAALLKAEIHRTGRKDLSIALEYLEKTLNELG